jgi:hypothetical protein
MVGLAQSERLVLMSDRAAPAPASGSVEAPQERQQEQVLAQTMPMLLALVRRKAGLAELELLVQQFERAAREID